MGLLSAEHLGALAVIAAAGIALVFAARLRSGPWVDVAAWLLGAVILVDELSWWLYGLPRQGAWSPAYGLPLQLCDVAAFVAVAALWTRWWPLVELTYFWGLAGTIQALLTPDLKQHFPAYPYWQFYVAHGGVVIAACLLTVGLRLSPRAGAVARVFLLTVGFAALAGLANAVTGGNYMYLRRRPSAGSLLNLMGPWPWYIATGAALALALLIVLDVPFWASRRQR